MNYLLVFKSDGKHYLIMTKSEEFDGYAIDAYKSKEEVMSSFKSFTDGWTASYERSMSCTIAMMNMQPVAIKAPEDVNELEKYIIEKKLFHVTGGAILGGYNGIPVKEEILELKEFDIWSETMKLGGIKETDEQIAEHKKQERENRVKIFEDTKKITGWLQRNSSTIKKNFFSIEKPIDGKPGYIGVANSDTVSAAMMLSRMGKTCILNMASNTKAGGGVATGEQAQEECLFRCSNLWETVIQDFYPLEDYECLYTTEAIFFKDKDYHVLGVNDQFNVDVVTIPAINLNRDSYYDEKKETWVDVVSEKPKDYEHLTKKKMRLMFSMAMKHGVENIVLGAWGCGVFKNNPEDMAKMFKEVLDEGYANSFKRIHFAIINDSNSNGNNFQAFVDVFHDSNN